MAKYASLGVLFILCNCELQKENEKLDREIIELQKKLDTKQALELEMERMRGALQVMKHMEE